MMIHKQPLFFVFMRITEHTHCLWVFDNFYRNIPFSTSNDVKNDVKIDVILSSYSLE